MSDILFSIIVIGIYLFAIAFGFGTLLFPRKFIDHSLKLQHKFLSIYNNPDQKPLIDPRGEISVFTVRAFGLIVIIFCAIPIVCLSYIAIDCAKQGCIVNGNPVGPLWN